MSGHESRPALSSSAEPPETWECRVCGQPAGPSRTEPPPATTGTAFHKTPYEFLMMRRTEAEGEALLEEALANLRSRRRDNGGRDRA